MKNDKMEEDVEPKDEDGVDGRGFSGWDVCVCGLGPVGSSTIFGLVRRSRTFTVVFPTFVLVSRFITEQYRVNDNFLNVVSSSRRESMVGSALTRVCVGSGVGGVTIVSGSFGRPSYSWISRLLTSSLSLGISSLFCRVTQCM